MDPITRKSMRTLREPSHELAPWASHGPRSETMKQLPFLRLAALLAVAALAGCASTDDAGPPVVLRTAAPQGYESTINNYFAFRIRGSQDDAVIGVSAPEPGACPLGGHSASSRGWVVPTVYETRTREASGKGTVHITTKQYYFWFLGNTIAGISPRLELCPGAGMTIGDDVPAKPVADGSDPARVAGGQTQEAANEVKKASTPPVVSRSAKKAGSPPAKVSAPPAKQTQGQ